MRACAHGEFGCLILVCVFSWQLGGPSSAIIFTPPTCVQPVRCWMEEASCPPPHLQSSERTCTSHHLASPVLLVCLCSHTVSVFCPFFCWASISAIRKFALSSTPTSPSIQKYGGGHLIAVATQPSPAHTSQHSTHRSSWGGD